MADQLGGVRTGKICFQSSVAGKSAVPGSGQCEQPGAFRANCGRHLSVRAVASTKDAVFANRPSCSWGVRPSGLNLAQFALPVPSEWQRAP